MYHIFSVDKRIGHDGLIVGIGGRTVCDKSGFSVGVGGQATDLVSNDLAVI